MDLKLILQLKKIFHFQAIQQKHKRNVLTIANSTHFSIPLYISYLYFIFRYIKINNFIFTIPLKNLKNQNMLGALASIGKSILPGVMSLGKDLLGQAGGALLGSIASNIGGVLQNPTMA